jgi:hypothetical protein
MAYQIFTAGQVLTASDTNTYLANSMATFVNSTNITAGASSVTVSNCFTSEYDRYKIVINTKSSAVGSAQYFVLTPNVTNGGNYTSGMYQLATSGTVLTFNVSNAAFVILGLAGNEYMSVEVDNYNATPATGKIANIRWGSYDTSASYGGSNTLWGTNTGVNTGFTLAIGGGLTMGTGVVRVYGYRKLA